MTQCTRLPAQSELHTLTSHFDITTSQTHLTWVNYNDIFPVLPEEGENAYVIRLWQTDVQLNRQNAAATLASETPIVELPAGTSSYSVDVPPSTRQRNILFNHILSAQLFGSSASLRRFTFPNQ